MSENAVTFKGTVNGLTILLNDNLEFDVMLKEIEAKIASAGKFFKGARLSVKYRGRKLSEEEEKMLYSLFVAKSGAEIMSLEEDTEEPETQVSRNDTETQRNKPDIKKFYYFKGTKEGQTRFYRGTVRSGQLIN
jgi:septum site-determining protein MinC